MRILLVLLSTLTLAAQGPFDGKSGSMVKAGYDLMGKGQFNEAIAKFQEGMKVDPTSSYPVSGLSKLFFEASKATDAAHQSEYRGRAESLARQALDRNDLDFIANEVLLNLDGGSVQSTHQPKPDAQAVFSEAEAAFQAQKWVEAVAGYQKALSLDPDYTDAALYLGDTYFSQKQYDKAEPWFRKAAEMEPRYGRAWRFLTDCYGHMVRNADALAADFSAIAAQPDDYTAWGRLRQVYETQQKIALVRFHWPHMSSGEIKRDAAGKTQVSVAQPEDEKDSPEGLAEVVFSIVHPTLQLADQNPDDKDRSRSDLDREARVLKIVLERYEAALNEKKASPKDAAWAQMLAFYKADQLESALMILRFREVYRPDFEAWKAAHPKGVQAFIEQWHLRP